MSEYTSCTRCGKPISRCRCPSPWGEENKALRARIAALEESNKRLLVALKDAQEAMDERRLYCDMWEYKYGEQWDEEDARIAEALAEESKK